MKTKQRMLSDISNYFIDASAFQSNATFSWQGVFSNDGKMVALRGGEVRVSSEWNVAISIRFSGYGFSCKMRLTPPGEMHECILEDEFLDDANPGNDQTIRKLVQF